MADPFEIISRVYGTSTTGSPSLGNVQPDRPIMPTRSSPDQLQENAKATSIREHSQFQQKIDRRNSESESFLQHVNELRGDFDWDGAWMWDARIITTNSVNPLPSPFDKWVPFVTFSYPWFSTVSKTFDLNLDTYILPHRRNTRIINATYLDTQDLKFSNWLRRWSDVEIFNNGKGVTPVVDAAKELQFIKLNSLKKIVGTDILFVVPDGDLTYEGQSESGLPMYTVTFNIVGTGSNNSGSTSPTK